MRRGRRKSSSLTAFPAFTLSFDDLCARRGGRRVVEGASASLSNGRRLDLKGPNGSGKTSLLRIFAGLIRPEDGRLSLEIGGRAVSPREPGHVAWVADRDALRPELTVAETLRFWAAFPAMTGGDSALAALGLEPYADTPVRLLSRGWRRRTALARALMSDAPIWLLDEPFAGLDEDGADRFGAALGEHLARGGGAVIARHAANAGPPAHLTLILERPE